MHLQVARRLVFLAVFACALLAGPALRPLIAADAWVPLGPPGGDISHLIVHPRNPRILWAGSPYTGIFKSTDGGASWRPVNQGLADLAVRALAVAPSAPNTLYAATGIVPVLVYRSSDGGESWEVVLPCGEVPPPCCGCVPLASAAQLVVHPREPRTVYAATARGVFKSVDGGAQWRATGPRRGTLSVAIDPRNPEILYAGGYIGVYASRNGGASWERVGQGSSLLSISHLVIAPADSRRIWAGGTEGFHRSTDGGAHWQRSEAGLTDRVLLSLALQPAAGAGLPTLWAGTPTGAFRSRNGGLSWSSAGPGLRNRWVGAIAAHPGGAGTLWAGTRFNTRPFAPGVFKSVDGGATWRASSRGIFYMRTSAVVPDPAAPGVLWAASPVYGVFRSADGGATWAERNGNLPRFQEFAVYDLAIDPADPQTLWASTSRGVYVSEDGGATWEARREGLAPPGRPRPFLGRLWLAPSDPSVAYVEARSPQLLCKTADRGEHWTCRALPRLPVFVPLQDVVVDPRDPDVVAVALQDVWISRDGGVSWEERVPVGDVPMVVEALAGDPGDPDVLYAGGAEGVFRSRDGGRTWLRVADLTITWNDDLAVGPTGRLWVETRDGVSVSPDGVSGWTLVPWREDGNRILELVPDPHRPDTLFIVTDRGIYRHRKGD
jgi:photosystem II stability/assembly factor-like uncharacterized protein